MRRPVPCGSVRRGQRPVTEVGAGAASGPEDLLTQRLIGGALVEPVDVQPLEGARQQGLLREPAHVLAIGRDAVGDRALALSLGGRVLTARNPDACGQPAQVPLPASRVRLVEVVEVDDEVALRRGVEAEVAQVGVAADHRRDPGGREVAEIVGHHPGGPPEEPVRRGRHPAHPDRDQRVHPALVRSPDLLHDVGSAGPRGPRPQRRAWHLPADLPSEAVPLGPWRRATPQRGIRLSVDGRKHHMAAGQRGHVIHRRIVPRSHRDGAAAGEPPCRGCEGGHRGRTTRQVPIAGRAHTSVAR